MPNAPTVRPPSLATALAIARKKVRPYTEAKPLRLLAVGRFDHEKGIDRVARVAADLYAHKLPCEVRIVGKAVFTAMPEISEHVTVLPAVLDSETLAAYYSEADVLLLLSRSEGIPLALLEGMAFGCIAIATDVGAIASAITDGETGILLDAHQEEEALVASVRRRVRSIIAGPEAFEAIRVAAVHTGLRQTWQQSAEEFARVIETFVHR
jgi:glycosyltransferase involved in cell wall biosynthesis